MKHFTRLAMTACMAGGLACAASAAKRDADTSGVRMFMTQARLTVDADGQVRSIEPDPALSQAVQQLIRQSALGWRFEPALLAGKAVGGVTHANLRACAAAVDGDLRMQVALVGTGPRQVGPARPGPMVSALKAGEMARFKVTYRVDPSGAATLEDVEQLEGRRSLLKSMRRSTDGWMAGQRFIPEQLDSQAVATRMSTEISMASGYSMDEIKKRLPEVRAIAAQEQDCASALKSGATPSATPVALDSPFRMRAGSS